MGAWADVPRSSGGAPKKDVGVPSKRTLKTGAVGSMKFQRKSGSKRRGTQESLSEKKNQDESDFLPQVEEATEKTTNCIF
jgi:hypothetical protein